VEELTDTITTNEVTTFLDHAEEDGFVTEAALEALAQAHDLGEDEATALRAELEARGVHFEEAKDELGEEQELDLSFDLTAAGVPDAMTLFMNEIGRYPLLSAAQEVELAKRIERGDRQAKERMINSNLRLVVHNARRYTGHGVALGDLVQEGIVGLNRAVEKFDWRKGFKFSTYATWWIRQACQRAIANQSKTIRIPVHVDERRNKLARTRQRFEVAHGREPTVEELAEAAGMSLQHAQEALDAVEASVSLNQTVGEDGELGELFADPQSADPETAAGDALRSVAVRRALAKLPERERRIVELRFGFEGESMALEAIGRELGITRERVRQLEGEALKLLASELETVVAADPDDLADAA
jgi:RNA polymerase primary sigma factor